MTYNRRQLLKGLGAGAVLLEAFAGSLEQQAHGAEAQGNFFFFFTPNGYVRSSHGSTGNDSGFTLRKSMAGCESFKDKISVVRGLCNKSTTAKASHEEITRLLSCVSGSDMYQAYGPTIDHEVASHFGGRPLSLGAVAEDPAWNTKLSFRGARALDQHEYDAKRVFGSVFGAGIPTLSPSAPTGDDKSRVQQQQRIVDFLKQDLAVFQSRLGGEEKKRLNLHVEAINDLEKKIAIAPSAPMEMSNCDSARATQLGSNSPGNIKARGERLIDLAALSFACGLRRSATILMEKASSGHNPITGAPAPAHHSISHGMGGGRTEREAIDKYYGDQFAYLLRAMANVGVLDRTMIVWGSEITEAHSQNNMLFTVAGGGALGVQHRKTIELPFSGSDGEGSGLAVAKRSENTSLSNLWVTVQKALGVPKSTFGEFSTGVIPGLLRS